MTTPTSAVQQTNHPQIAGHYDAPNLAERILEGLRMAGKDPESLGADDLAPVDEFHIRGREATEELAGLLELKAGSEVLDIGSGLGGTARFLAGEFGCQVTGIDLTQSYCDVATSLSSRVGLADRTRFTQASALELPHDDASFDVVWTEHVQMNIEDKVRFYSEAARVLRPGGHLVFHDVFAGADGPVTFPVPWASDSSMSFLATPEETRELVNGLGLSELEWIITTAASVAWFEAAAERNANNGGPPPLGIHLLMGDTAKIKFGNLMNGLRDSGLCTVEAVFQK